MYNRYIYGYIVSPNTEHTLVFCAVNADLRGGGSAGSNVVDMRDCGLVLTVGTIGGVVVVAGTAVAGTVVAPPPRAVVLPPWLGSNVVSPPCLLPEPRPGTQ